MGDIASQYVSRAWSLTRAREPVFRISDPMVRCHGLYALPRIPPPPSHSPVCTQAVLPSVHFSWSLNGLVVCKLFTGVGTGTK